MLAKREKLIFIVQNELKIKFDRSNLIFSQHKVVLN